MAGWWCPRLRSRAENLVQRIWFARQPGMAHFSKRCFTFQRFTETYPGKRAQPGRHSRTKCLLHVRQGGQGLQELTSESVKVRRVTLAHFGIYTIK